MNNNKFFIVIKSAYIILLTVSFFTLIVSTVTEGVDGSWIYMLNRYSHLHQLWGRNIIFTYGPLGFLLMPLPIGNNLAFSLIFWIFITGLACILFSYTLFSEKLYAMNSRRDNILLSMILFYIAFPMAFSDILPEYIPYFVILFMLSLCWFNHNTYLFTLASLLSLFSLFMKFNAGIINFASIFLFAFITAMQSKSFKFLLITFLTALAFPICFLLYNPDISELTYYIRGMFEISSGYISAMSYGFPNWIFFTYWLITIAVFIFIMSSVKFSGSFSPMYALLFAPGVFLALKHGLFVRGWGLFLPLFCIICSIYLLFSEMTVKFKPTRFKFITSCTLLFFSLTFIITAMGLNTRSVLGKVMYAKFLTNPVASVIQKLNLPDSIKDNQEYVLPGEFMNIISGDTASAYPWELSYAKYIPNFVTMPVIQAYSAYTSWLDGLNAEFFRDYPRAPKFIVMTLEAIDERYPLIECPATWLEIFRNYSLNARSIDQFLLERTGTKDLKLYELETMNCNKDSIIELPKSRHIITMRLDMKLSVLGRLAHFLFRIPRTDLSIEFADGTKTSKRVIIDNLSSETIISNIITSNDEFQDFMNGDINAGRVKSIQFGGKGLFYYDKNINVTFSELR